jgi:hypothetical protein
VTFDEQKLYELLPAIYRIRDAESVSDPSQVPPLKALLRIIAEQIGVLEENLAQLYDLRLRIPLATGVARERPPCWNNWRVMLPDGPRARSNSSSY